ncbi:hypothetical protein [Roseateles sp.]|uniref:hypothetical protein n=1 Tax=Roseateles sp. TaxID=1971397 RepID=UPI002DFF442A|nr:hypothetical protein [Roseateles sp.]
MGITDLLGAFKKIVELEASIKKSAETIKTQQTKLQDLAEINIRLDEQLKGALRQVDELHKAQADMERRLREVENHGARVDGAMQVLSQGVVKGVWTPPPAPGLGRGSAPPMIDGA